MVRLGFLSVRVQIKRCQQSKSSLRDEIKQVPEEQSRGNEGRPPQKRVRRGIGVNLSLYFFPRIVDMHQPRTEIDVSPCGRCSRRPEVVLCVCFGLVSGIGSKPRMVTWRISRRIAMGLCTRGRASGVRNN